MPADRSVSWDMVNSLTHDRVSGGRRKMPSDEVHRRQRMARPRPAGSPMSGTSLPLNRTPKPMGTGATAMQGQRTGSPLSRTIQRPKRKRDDMMTGNAPGRIRRPQMPAQQAAPANNRLGARVPKPNPARPQGQRPYGGRQMPARPQMAEEGQSPGRAAMRRRQPKARSAAMPKPSMM